MTFLLCSKLFTDSRGSMQEIRISHLPLQVKPARKLWSSQKLGGPVVPQHACFSCISKPHSHIIQVLGNKDITREGLQEAFRPVVEEGPEIKRAEQAFSHGAFIFWWQRGQGRAFTWGGAGSEAAAIRACRRNGASKLERPGRFRYDNSPQKVTSPTLRTDPVQCAGRLRFRLTPLTSQQTPHS